MFQPIDQYCERLGSGLWAEPLNVLTNLAFIISALFARRLACQLNTNSVGATALWSIMLFIGVGSVLFHTVANGLTKWMDILPILFFQLTYLWVYCRQVIIFSMTFSSLAMLGFGMMVFLSQWDASLLNGSIGYVPAFVAILLLALFHFFSNKRARYSLLLSVFLFGLSLCFRAIDLRVCEHLPMGTHFLWHVINALVLYIAVRGLYLNVGRIPNDTSQASGLIKS